MARSTTVLIVDDDPHFCREMTDALMEDGHQCKQAAEEGKAEHLIAKGSICAVILGTIAPRGAAFRLHQLLRQTPLTHDIPIVVVDAKRENQLTRGWRRDEAMQMETPHYFQKPVRKAAVAAALDRALDRAAVQIRVLVADDHAMVREGIRALLSLQRDIVIVDEAVDGGEAVEKARRHTPDVVLMDIVMPGMNGLEATRRICSGRKDTKVVMLSQYDDDENVMASTQMGAQQFISKREVSSRLVEAIRAVSTA